MNDDEQDTQLTCSLHNTFIAVGKPPKRLQCFQTKCSTGWFYTTMGYTRKVKKTRKVLTKNNMHFDSDAFSWATCKCLQYNGSEEVEKVKKTKLILQGCFPVMAAG